MNLAALGTSAGINVAVCVVVFSLYSILRKQPSQVTVYFGRRLSTDTRKSNKLCLDRFVPSASWIVKAWKTTEDELLTTGGLDSVVFMRIIVFSLRIFSIAAITCVFIVLPVNYRGKVLGHKRIPLETLEVFTILNVQEGSKWLWTHCLALYVITFSACVLLYVEYKRITKMRLAHINGSPLNPSHFTVVVRAIPWSPEESYGDSVRKFFMKYHESSYLSHQMVYRSGRVQKLMSNARKMCKILKDVSIEQKHKPGLYHCGFCGAHSDSFKILSHESESARGKSFLIDDGYGGKRKKVCAAAFVFFKTRYAAVVTSQVLHSSNPMQWVTQLAPEPHDVYWSNLWIPYGQLWIRKIATLVAAVAFMLVFLLPVTIVQGMTHADKLQKTIPFLEGPLKRKFISQLLTGYLPSVVLIVAFYTVPPIMMLISTLEGSISRSGRKKSACFKILYFTIWNVFVMNVFTGTVMDTVGIINKLDSVKDLPAQLASAIPAQAKFFMTYVLSSGWAGLACELMQLYPLLCNFIRRYIFRMKDWAIGTMSFPYHTEIPRLLLFGFIGFTCSIMVPLILPFLLVYFTLAYFIYRNQMINVYIRKYETGGHFWPLVHNTVIFSLVMMQIIALGVFGLRQSPVSSGFTIPLVIFTFLFNQYCRQRFLPVFKNHVAEILIDMDREDEKYGRTEEIHQQLHAAYCQSPSTSPDSSMAGSYHHQEEDSIQDPENVTPGKEVSQVSPSWSIASTFGAPEAI
ncbi:putative calcium-dependent channel, 7TM region phosphate [Rosa chinensis]|uniref:Putative calcium-dependent channel, 7TM region phosphate n=1 Tax=Rosa chinensis TaxID=74649 RepID=A0A2P6Q159_ROSCH|nr:CSC1-like protein RXW8 isoform X1 [Rosa chinensis]PRQ27896.1 putative calcium-dependent channel, 7TM region phosphate [Rosa chinensis]